MADLLVIDDPFTGPDTNLVPGENSKPFGDDWTDRMGGRWRRQNNQAAVPVDAGTVPTDNALYQPVAFVNGRVRIYSNSATNGIVARLDPTDNSGYGAFVYQQNEVYFTVNGAQVDGGRAIGATINVPHYSDWTVTQSTSTQTTISVSFYDLNDTQLGTTVNFTNAAANLQNREGFYGIGTFHGNPSDRVVIYKTVPGGPITDPDLFLVTAFRDQLTVASSGASGGVGALTYQLYISLIPGELGTAVSGATNLQNTLLNRTPGTTYYLTLIASDEGGQHASSTQLAVTTVKPLAEGGHVLLTDGNSITRGNGSPDLPARVVMINRLRQLGISCEHISTAVDGTDTAAAIARLDSTITTAKLYGADTISLMTGTNDITSNLTKEQFKTVLKQYCAAVLADGTGINTVILHYNIYRVSDSVPRLPGYNEAIFEVCRDENMGGRILLGDTTMYDYIKDRPELYGDGTHSNPPGHFALGTAWGNAIYTAYTTAIANPVIAPATGTLLQVGDLFTLSSQVADAIRQYRLGTSGTWLNYTGPVALNTPGNVTVQARAFRLGFPVSTTTTSSYTVEGEALPQVAAPTFDPASGAALTVGQSVTLSSTTPGAVFHWQIDDDTPQTGATISFPSAGTFTVTAYATAPNMVDSDAVTATYTVTAPGGGNVDLSAVLAALAALSAKVDTLVPAPGVIIPGDVRFEFDLISTPQRLASSTEYVIVAVRGFRGPLPLYAPDYTVQLAITKSSPQSADFHAASWNQDGLSALLVGPAGGALTLTPGVYYVHAKVPNAPETTVARVGLLTVL